VELELANASVSMTRRPELAQASRLDLGGRDLHLVGFPGWLVNYAELAYRSQPAEIAPAVERLAAAWLQHPEAGPHGLARLSGVFFLLVVQQGRLERLVTSDELPNNLYWRSAAGRLEISDDPWPWLEEAGLFDLEAWSADNLAYLDRKKTCLPGETLVRGLHRLMPATCYRAGEGSLEPEAAVYPLPEPGRRPDFGDLLGVIGRRLEPGGYTLAYSSGVDSHHLLASLGDRIRQVCTISYAPPFHDPERTAESAAAVINTALGGRPLTLVQADFTEPRNLDYLRHAVERDPFACHLSFTMYQMMRRASQPRVLTGQNADTVQWFGLTSTIPLGWLFATSPLPNYASDWQRLAYRRQVARSYGRAEVPRLTRRRLFYGLWDRVAGLVGPHGYWPILHFKRINNMTSGNTQLFHHAAAYFGKTVHFAYTEPLALYVSAYWRRPLATLRDPKAALRRLHPERLDHRAIPRRVPAGMGFERSPAFAACAQEAAEAAPELKRRLDELVTEPMARAFVYRLAARALEGRGA
jgi:hypothetical protein